MADIPVVHIGENSPEFIAYRLMRDIVRLEKGAGDRKKLLDTYAECLRTVKDPANRPRGSLETGHDG